MPHVDRETDAERRARRWAAVVAERERLLELSRRRTLNQYDAEDCVQEALLRSVEFDGLDEERVAPFLTTVTMRLCADQHRARQRQDRLDRRAAGRRVEEPGPEEAICEQAEAAWVAGSLGTLTSRQREVVKARMTGLSDSEIASHLGLSYSAVASALARTRTAVRAIMAAGCAWVVAVVRRPRTAAVVTAAAAAAVAITTMQPVAVAPADPPALTAPRQEITLVQQAEPVAWVAPRRVPAPTRRRAASGVGRPAAGPPGPKAGIGFVGTGRTLPEEIVYCIQHLDLALPHPVICPSE